MDILLGVAILCGLFILGLVISALSVAIFMRSPDKKESSSPHELADIRMRLYRLETAHMTVSQPETPQAPSAPSKSHVGIATIQEGDDLFFKTTDGRHIADSPEKLLEDMLEDPEYSLGDEEIQMLQQIMMEYRERYFRDKNKEDDDGKEPWQ